MTKDEESAASLRNVSVRIGCPLDPNDINIVDCVPTADKTSTTKVARFPQRTKK